MLLVKWFNELGFFVMEYILLIWFFFSCVMNGVVCMCLSLIVLRVCWYLWVCLNGCSVGLRLWGFFVVVELGVCVFVEEWFSVLIFMVVRLDLVRWLYVGVNVGCGGCLYVGLGCEVRGDLFFFLMVVVYCRCWR